MVSGVPVVVLQSGEVKGKYRSGADGIVQTAVGADSVGQTAIGADGIPWQHCLNFKVPFGADGL